MTQTQQKETERMPPNAKANIHENTPYDMKKVDVMGTKTWKRWTLLMVKKSPGQQRVWWYNFTSQTEGLLLVFSLVTIREKELSITSHSFQSADCEWTHPWYCSNGIYSVFTCMQYWVKPQWNSQNYEKRMKVAVILLSLPLLKSVLSLWWSWRQHL